MSSDGPSALTIARVVIEPLRVEHVMHGDDVIPLAHRTRPDTTQLLHVSTDTEQQAQVNTKRTDISSSLAADPEDTKVAVVVELDQFGLVDGADTELTLDG